mmetsp:Transcript_7224/g.14767  ORF Transcript_7224/g.14767 Transcript_7224/m.14767 type:complete len:143 (-) Transcript_7224:329-757(-)
MHSMRTQDAHICTLIHTHCLPHSPYPHGNCKQSTPKSAFMTQCTYAARITTPLQQINAIARLPSSPVLASHSLVLDHSSDIYSYAHRLKVSTLPPRVSCFANCSSVKYSGGGPLAFGLPAKGVKVAGVVRVRRPAIGWLAAA